MSLILPTLKDIMSLSWRNYFTLKLLNSNLKSASKTWAYVNFNGSYIISFIFIVGVEKHLLVATYFWLVKYI